MTFIAHHSRLEISFLMDEFALPPAAPDENLLNLSGLGDSTPTTPEDDRLRHLAEELSQSREETDPPVAMATENDGGITISVKQEGSLQQKTQKEDGEKEEKMTVGSCSAAADKTKEAVPEIVIQRTLSDSGGNVESKKSSPVRKISVDSSLKPSTESNEGSSTYRRSVSDSTGRTSKRTIKEYGGTEVVDFSDPLQSYQKSKDESIFEATTKEKLREEKQQGACQQ